MTIFDCDGVAWSMHHSLGAKLSYEGSGTGVIHGFLNHVFASQSYEMADVVVFAWDSNSHKRREIFPEYKKKRHDAKNEYTQEEKEIDEQRAIQFSLLKNEILTLLGFNNVFFEDGFEGDDIIASVVNRYKGQYLIKIVARDKDLLQLVDNTVTMFDPVQNKYYTKKSIIEKYGIEPKQFKDVKAICGCPTDEVPGVTGIGEATALKYVKGELPYHYKAYKTIENASSVIALTRMLTSLPFDGTPSFKVGFDSCTENRLKMIARKYGLKSFVTSGRLADYRRIFCEKTTRLKPIITKEKDSDVWKDGRGMGAAHNNGTEF